MLLRFKEVLLTQLSESHISPVILSMLLDYTRSPEHKLTLKSLLSSSPIMSSEVLATISSSTLLLRIQSSLLRPVASLVLCRLEDSEGLITGEISGVASGRDDGGAGKAEELDQGRLAALGSNTGG